MDKRKVKQAIIKTLKDRYLIFLFGFLCGGMFVIFILI